MSARGMAGEGRMQGSPEAEPRNEYGERFFKPQEHSEVCLTKEGCYVIGF